MLGWIVKYDLQFPVVTNSVFYVRASCGHEATLPNNRHHQLPSFSCSRSRIPRDEPFTIILSQTLIVPRGARTPLHNLYKSGPTHWLNTARSLRHECRSAHLSRGDPWLDDDVMPCGLEDNRESNERASVHPSQLSFHGKGQHVVEGGLGEFEQIHFLVHIINDTG